MLAGMFNTMFSSGSSGAPAPFPVIASTVTTNGGVASTTITAALPASIAAGDLLMIFIGANGPAANFSASGWTTLKNGAISTANLGVLYKLATGSEGASVVVTSTVSAKLESIAARITGWDGATAPAMSTLATGTSASPNPANLAPGWTLNTLWIAAMVDGDIGGVSTWPTSYSLNQTSIINGESLAMCARNLNAASDDPSAFTIPTSDIWDAITLAIHP
jgi:hypothetical protein